VPIYREPNPAHSSPVQRSDSRRAKVKPPKWTEVGVKPAPALVCHTSVTPPAGITFQQGFGREWKGLVWERGCRHHSPSTPAYRVERRQRLLRSYMPNLCCTILAGARIGPRSALACPPQPKSGAQCTEVEGQWHRSGQRTRLTCLRIATRSRERYASGRLWQTIISMAYEHIRQQSGVEKELFNCLFRS